MRNAPITVQLVAITNGKPTIDTLALANGTRSSHGAVIKLVRGYVSDLGEYGRVRFEIRPFATLGGVQNREIAILNEPQTTLIMTYMKNSPVIREFKKRLVREFYQMERALRHKHDPSFQQQRIENKIGRRAETDTLARFVDYATAQGSQSARLYYMNVTKMTHQALNLMRQAAPQSLRDTIDSMELSFLTTAEYLVQQTIEEGMVAALPYKDIYRLAKERVTTYAETLPIQRRISA